MLKELQDKLLDMNVNHMTEKKNKLTYLSWAKAWDIVLREYPDATYTIKKNPEGTPEFGSSKFGYMVYTDVTIENVTREMWLFVMDGANKPLKDEPYTYQVKDWNESKRQNKTIMTTKHVDSINMFDINKTVMRCLVKNLAMFGLGLYIYAGEDLPIDSDETPPPKQQAPPKTSGVSEAQIKRLNAIAYGKGYDFNSVLETAKKKYKINTLDQLNKSQYDEMCKGYESLNKK